MAKNDIIKFEMSQSNLRTLLDKMKDLTKIDKRLVIRFDKDTLIIFSFVGESFKNIFAFKNYIFKNVKIVYFYIKVYNFITIQ